MGSSLLTLDPTALYDMDARSQRAAWRGITAGYCGVGILIPEIRDMLERETYHRAKGPMEEGIRDGLCEMGYLRKNWINTYVRTKKPIYLREPSQKLGGEWSYPPKED